MKLSFRALKTYVDFTGSAQECADLFAELGFPNDGMRVVGANIEGVVLGRIESMRAHPQADRLSLLEVHVGESSPLPIVCGAKNMKPGDYVALARVGAKIPGADGKGFELKKAKIRGEISEGMCCSEVELGIAEESEGIWIISPEDLGKDPSSLLGKDIKSIMDLEDVIFEIDVTPNRGDALSVRGLARELAAKLELKLKTPNLYRWKHPSQLAHPSIESFEDAYGFAACFVKSVKNGKTPWKWRQFLHASGGRSIGTLVDITNIVLFELGHPIHFFDADRVDAQSIQVRRARPGERLLLLNNQWIDLHPEDLVIADSHRVLSLAGVMGGAETAVSARTENILVEVASFNPARIRATARRHQLSSESSYRFERGVTSFRLDETMERALALLQELSGFESASGSKVIHRNLQRPSCLWNRQRVESKLGKLELSDNEIFDRLRRLEYELDPRSSVPQLVFPWYRTDAFELEDAMEDIARLIGYENLERKRLQSEESVPVLQDLKTTTDISNKLLDDFISKGFVETIHWSFTDPRLEKNLSMKVESPVEIVNPIHAEKSQLRTSLLPQLLERARWNAAHGEEEIRLVEVGPVFSWDESSNYQNSPASEIWRLACVWCPRPADRKRLWHYKHDDFFEFKGILEFIFFKYEQDPEFKLSEIPGTQIFHPKRYFQVPGGIAGELHPLIADRFDIKNRAFVAETLLYPLRLKPMVYKSPSLYPAIDLDVSLSVDRSIKVQDLLSKFEACKTDLVESVRIYDIYETVQDQERRALTFALRYRSPDRTLEMTEARAAHETLIQSVIQSFPKGQLALR